jgi:hypothetical protein
MAPLTQDRLATAARSGDTRELPVKAATKIYAGSLVAIDASGWAVPMATATTLKGAGRAEQQADNSAGANGDIRVKIGAGIYRFANSASTDTITLSDIGADCYGVDDQTVAKTSGSSTRSVAGKVFDVDALGVWVKFS